MKPKKIVTWIVMVSAITSCLFSCSGPDEKKVKFLNKGKALYEKQNYTMAKLEFKNAIQIDVNYVDAYYYLGLCELGDKDYQKAYAHLFKAETLAPDNIEVKIELGKLYMAARQSDKVKAKVEEILAKDAANRQGLLLKSSVYLQAGKLDEAETLLNELKDGDAHEPELYMMLSSLYTKQAHSDKSEAILLEGEKKNPDNKSLKIALALYYSQNKNDEKLSVILKEFMEQEPEKDEHKYALADVYFRTNQKEKAIALLYTTLIAKDEHEVRSKNYVRLAEYFFRLNEKELAEKTLQDGMNRFDKDVDLLLALSNFYYNDNKADEGFNLLEKGLSYTDDNEDPVLIRVKNKLAEIHILKNEKEKASGYIDDVLSVSPKNIDALYMHGLLLMNDGKYFDAITALRTVIAENPKSVNAYLNLTKSYVMNNQPELAYDTLKRGVNSNPDSKDLRMVLIRYHMKNKDLSGAEKEFTALTEHHPKDLGTFANFGDLYLAEKKYDQAHEHYDVIKKIAPDHYLAYVKIANLYETQGQTEKAFQELKKADDLSPDNPNVILPMVKLMAEQKRYPEAKALCQDQIDKKKDEPLYYNILGRLLFSEKKYDPSEKAFLKATELKPEWKDPYLNLAKLYITQKKQKTALKIFEAISAKNPDSMSAAMILAILYENEKQYQKSIDVYKRIVKKMPGNLDAANNLAFLLGEYPQNDADIREAITYAQNVVDKRPDDLAALDTLAWLYYRMGDMTKASALINQVLVEKPDNPVINYHAGMVYLKQDRVDEAKSALEKAVNNGKDYHGYPDAKAALDKLKAGLNS
ncbi:MAG: tetratricopeptide repeat protein [Proteobacteria bacterium]|nr:tetratricopeptide repeat protein [Pseudomonadota bacterium]